MSEEQYEKTKILVEEFGKAGGEGEQLQKMLKDYAEKEENWVKQHSNRFSGQNNP